MSSNLFLKVNNKKINDMDKSETSSLLESIKERNYIHNKEEILNACSKRIRVLVKEGQNITLNDRKIKDMKKEEVLSLHKSTREKKDCYNKQEILNACKNRLRTLDYEDISRNRDITIKEFNSLSKQASLCEFRGIKRLSQLLKISDVILPFPLNKTQIINNFKILLIKEKPIFNNKLIRA